MNNNSNASNTSSNRITYQNYQAKNLAEFSAYDDNSQPIAAQSLSTEFTHNAQSNKFPPSYYFFDPLSLQISPTPPSYHYDPVGSLLTPGLTVSNLFHQGRIQAPSSYNILSSPANFNPALPTSFSQGQSSPAISSSSSILTTATTISTGDITSDRETEDPITEKIISDAELENIEGEDSTLESPGTDSTPSHLVPRIYRHKKLLANVLSYEERAYFTNNYIDHYEKRRFLDTDGRTKNMSVKYYYDHKIPKEARERCSLSQFHQYLKTSKKTREDTGQPWDGTPPTLISFRRKVIPLRNRYPVQMRIDATYGLLEMISKAETQGKIVSEEDKKAFLEEEALRIFEETGEVVKFKVDAVKDWCTEARIYERETGRRWDGSYRKNRAEKTKKNKKIAIPHSRASFTEKRGRPRKKEPTINSNITSTEGIQLLSKEKVSRNRYPVKIRTGVVYRLFEMISKAEAQGKIVSEEDKKAFLEEEPLRIFEETGEVVKLNVNAVKAWCTEARIYERETGRRWDGSYKKNRIKYEHVNSSTQIVDMPE